MTLDEFKEKMKNDRYSNEYIELIDGKLLMFDYYKDESHDVSNYEDDNVAHQVGALLRLGANRAWQLSTDSRSRAGVLASGAPE